MQLGGKGYLGDQREKAAKGKKGKKKMYLRNSIGGGSQERSGGGHRSSVAGEGEGASLRGVEVELVGEEERRREQEDEGGREVEQ